MDVLSNYSIEIFIYGVERRPFVIRAFWRFARLCDLAVCCIAHYMLSNSNFDEKVC